MRYLRWWSRISAIGFFCYIIGSSCALVGTPRPGGNYTGSGIALALLGIFSILMIGFFAGLEHEREKKGE
jgi:hypothetical protein